MQSIMNTERKKSIEKLLSSKYDTSKSYYDTQLENLVRRTLGQTEFPDIKNKDCYEYYQTRPYHLRFDFHAGLDSEAEHNNLHTLGLFRPAFKNYDAVLSSYKGQMYCYFMTKEEYDARKFRYYHSHNGDEVEDSVVFNFTGYGTVGIIMQIIKIIQILELEHALKNLSNVALAGGNKNKQ